MIVSHLLILHKKIQFYIFMFEALNVAKGRKVQGGRILSQGTVCTIEVFHNSLHLILVEIPCFRSVRITTLF